MSIDKLIIPKIAANGTQSKILKAIRDYSPISRSRIVNLTGLPHAAVSRTVANLLNNKIVTEESLADINGPRRKRGLRLNPEFGYCLAVEYGPRGMEGAILDTAYRPVIRQNDTACLETISQDEKITKIVSFIKDLQEKAQSLPGECLGLAAIDPGVIDEQEGISLTASIMENWNNVPIAKFLQEGTGFAVMLLNTSMAKIRAVDRLELQNESQNLIYIEYGEGIACGMKLAGEYIWGQSNQAGEFGHLRITDSQIPCRCGGVGCLETMAALPALVRNAKEAIGDNSSSYLAQVESFDGLDILEAAANGDRLAERIVDEAFEYLSRAVAGLANILNPEIILFDNTIQKAGKDCVSMLKKSLNKNLLPSHCAKLDVRISSLNSYIGALGGAVAVLDYCLEA